MRALISTLRAMSVNVSTAVVVARSAGRSRRDPGKEPRRPRREGQAMATELPGEPVAPVRRSGLNDQANS
jgi:hypothetical protein